MAGKAWQLLRGYAYLGGRMVRPLYCSLLAEQSGWSLELVRVCLVSEEAEVFFFSFSSQIPGLGAGLCSQLREIKNVFKDVNHFRIERSIRLQVTCGQWSGELAADTC